MRGPPPVPGADDQIEPAVASRIAERRFGLRRGTWCRRCRRSPRWWCPASAVEDADARAATDIGGSDDIGDSVARDVAGAQIDAALERRFKCKEIADDEAGLAVVDADTRPGSGARGDDDVVHAVAVHIAGRHADAAGEASIERRERADKSRPCHKRQPWAGCPGRPRRRRSERFAAARSRRQTLNRS